jgi:osmotically-inducible protein OsmY
MIRRHGRARLPRLSVFALSILAAASLAGCASAPLGIMAGAGATTGVAAWEERGLKGAVSDTVIRAQINDAWFKRDVDMYREVNLDVYEGRVLLTGAVPNQKARADAVRLAREVQGVRDVIDEIQPDGATITDIARDTWITTQLRSQMTFDKQVQSINYSIVTVNGAVYLIGIAQDQAELDRVLNMARRLASVKRVVSHVLLRDDPRRFS